MLTREENKKFYGAEVEEIINDTFPKDDPFWIFDQDQRREIKKGYENGIDIYTYANKFVPDTRMRIIRLTIENKPELIKPFIDKGFTNEELSEICYLIKEGRINEVEQYKYSAETADATQMYLQRIKNKNK